MLLELFITVTRDKSLGQIHKLINEDVAHIFLRAYVNHYNTSQSHPLCHLSSFKISDS